MTNLRPLDVFLNEELPAYAEGMGDPSEWFVLIGDMVTEYSVWADEDLPEDYDEIQAEMLPEDRDANPNVEGYFQIGTAGWLSNCFEEDVGFVSEAQFGDKIDRRLLNILVVHEDLLTEEAIAVARGESEPEEVAP